MWAIGVQFLSGAYIATDSSDRESAEWPPHPLRLFMALAATYFETGGDPQQREFLQWLELQSSPTIIAGIVSQRSVVTTFVPVNDAGGGHSMPKVRSRQPRTFPATITGDEPVNFVWDGSIPEKYVPIAERLLRDVYRVGHSSSMVMAWLDLKPIVEAADDSDCWALDDGVGSGTPLRRVFAGAVAQLESLYNLLAINRHADLSEQIKIAKGKLKKDLKEQLQQKFPNGEPASRRPEFRPFARYRKLGYRIEPTVVQGVFDEDILVLTQQEGPTLGSETTLRVAKALRGTLLSTFSTESQIPEWISGHAPNGEPTSVPHLAIIPLTYVGDQYSDGHLLGMGVVFPRDISPRERGERLAKLLTNSVTGDDEVVLLKLGNLGVATLQVERRPAPPLALRAKTWTQPSRYWATVTPLVLDRFPKSDYDHHRSVWMSEVAETISNSCERAGLPQPTDIRISHNPYLSGVPRTKQTGNCFPPMPVKRGNGARCMVHALIAFDRLVRGPVLLGAGRFLGYGLCKPMRFRGDSQVLGQ